MRRIHGHNPHTTCTLAVTALRLPPLLPLLRIPFLLDPLPPPPALTEKAEESTGGSHTQ